MIDDRMGRPPRHRQLVQPVPRIRSEDLFGNLNEVVLLHEGQHYRLRRTRNGKLLLNK